MQCWFDALDYVSFGFKVFPLLPNKKIPAVSSKNGGRGCLDATDDEEILASWTKTYPNANIGIATGEISNLVVIDIDVKSSAGGEETVEELAKIGKIFPKTVEVLTPSGGRHLYYKYHPSISRNSAGKIGKGIDIRSCGGYVVAPPSSIDSKKYIWKNDFSGELRRLPMWLKVMLTPTVGPREPYIPKSGDENTHLLEFIRSSSEGERNSRLFWAICRMVESKTLDESEVLKAAISCGLNEIEVQKTVNSAKNIINRS